VGNLGYDSLRIVTVTDGSNIAIDALIRIVGVVVVVYGGVLVWLVKRVLSFERHVAERRSVINERLAIVTTNLENLEQRQINMDERNTAEHNQIETLLQGHHQTITQRLDGIVTAIRNGGRKS
jgi:hypothetical protein